MQRDEIVAEHQVHWNRSEQLMIDGPFAQIHIIAAIPRRQRLCLRRLGNRIGKFYAISSHGSSDIVGQ